MRTQRKFLAWLMALILSVSMIPTALAAEPANDADELTTEEQLTALIAALPDLADIDPLDDTTTLSGNCGPYDYTNKQYTNTVTWTLTPNASEDTYTLTISGDGPMGDAYTNKDTASSGAPGWANANITKVVIEDGVTSVGAKSFKNFSTLTEVTLPASITTIGQDAFYNTGITSIILPENLDTIEAQAFYNCTALTGTIKIPAGVKSIPTYAFAKTKITGAELAGDTTSIGTNAFLECTSLTSITLPNSIESISAGAFKGCTALTQVAFPQNSKFTKIEESAFQGCNALKVVRIPESVIEIGRYAFSGCTALEKVTLPDGLTTIGSEAFKGASSLVGVYIPASVTNISNSLEANNSIFKGMADNSVIYLGSDSQIDLMLVSSGNQESASNGFTLTTTALAVTNGGTFAPNTKFESGKLATPTKAGYTFGGWYSDAEFADTSKVTDSTQLQAGTTYYAKWEECAHKWVEATCTEPKTCSICGKTDGDALGHSYQEAVTAPTCTEEGYTTHTCSRCGDSYVDTYVSAAGHDWDDGVVTKEPTYSETGIRTYTCKNCGETKTEEIAKLTRPSGGSSSSGYTV